MTKRPAKRRSAPNPRPTLDFGDGPRCPTCQKPLTICVCDRAVPQPTRVRVLVLQHPQEQDLELGSARVLLPNLPKAQLAVGLSWRSLGAALGEDVDAERWAVLFPAKLPGAQGPDSPREDLGSAVPQSTQLVDRRGVPQSVRRIEGIVVLDGTWSQAKTLWWRNAWLLKLNRLALAPREPSIYGSLRREPRRNYVSTLEAVADALEALGEPPEVRTHLRRLFRTMVQRARDALRSGAES